MLKHQSVFHLSLIVTLLIAPSAFAAESHLLFDTNVKVSVLTKNGLSNEQSYDASKDITLKGDTAYWVSSPGKVPLLVVPQTAGDQDNPSKLQLPDVAMWPSETAQAQLKVQLTSVIEDLYQFQTAIVKKDVVEAEKILNRMESVQPMEYYSFLRASLAFVKGDLKTAKDQVQKGLKRYPANVQGAQLLKTIEGAQR